MKIKEVIKVKVKRITPTAIIPEKGSKFSAGYDLSADINNSILIRPQETVKIPTGLSFEVPEGYFGGIYARSGLATKQGLRPANAVGVCDSDYRGEYIVALHNDSNTTRIIEPGQRIAQVIFQPYLICDLEDVDELTETQRGDGGFGSTGIK